MAYFDATNATNNLPDSTWINVGGYPKITTNPNGQVMVSQGQTTLDKILSSVLTGVALIKNRPYIPTTQQPEQTGGYDAATLAILQAQQQQQLLANQGSTGANLGASLESLLKNNTGILLVGVVALVLFRSGRK